MPGDNLTPLEQINELYSRMDAVEIATKKPRDPVSQRLLALVTIVFLLSVVAFLGGIKAIDASIIAAILGAIAGRLTSNIGGTTDAPSNGGSK